MTNEEAKRIATGLRTDFKCESDTMVDFCNTVIKALEQEPCETIKEIPKDYKYDTETKDFLVYRHMYTGHEIHIEKPVPRYRLEQEPCNDTISRQEVLAYIDKMPSELTADGRRMIRRRTLEEYISDTLPSVTPQPKIGHWIEEVDDYGEVMRWHCDKCYEDSGFTTTCKWDYCPSCGAKMEEVEE